MLFSGVDPGFPVGWGANPQGVGRQHTNLPDFPKNCMELRKVWSVRGGRTPGAPPLDPPLILFIDTVNVFLKYLKHLDICGHVSCMDYLFMWPYLIKFDWFIDLFVMESGCNLVSQWRYEITGFGPLVSLDPPQCLSVCLSVCLSHLSASSHWQHSVSVSGSYSK